LQRGYFAPLEEDMAKGTGTGRGEELGPFIQFPAEEIQMRDWKEG
jgi:hypothetical protein